jgi:soluble lytic murein transglycosylase
MPSAKPLLALSLVALLLAPPAGAQTAAQGAALAKALAEARAGNWTSAAILARQAHSRVAADLVLWTRLRDGVGGWQEYEAFLARNADWPGLATLRRAGERHLPPDLPQNRVIAYFADNPPQTGIGTLRLADALASSGRAAEAEAEIARGWREVSMSRDEQKAILARWRDAVAPYHAVRLDHALWQGYTSEAEAMLPLVDPGLRAVGRARIAVRRDTEGLQGLIAAVPPEHRRDPGLAFERYLYRVNKGRWDEAETYLLEKSTTAEALGRPEMWMERRANLARQALRRGEVDAAYKLAAQSFGTGGPDYADSEWLAGFIALTRLDDPARAVEHFERFRSVVFTPISFGRAGYWLGLANERAGDSAAAQAAFAMGAEHQTSFYGQLAAERAARPADARLAGGGVKPPDWRHAPIMGSSVVQAARLLDAADDDARVSQFLRHAAEGQPAETRAVLAQMAIELGRPHIAIRIAKDAAGEGVLIPDQYYPLHAIARGDWPVPTEFALAIARQESELNPAAVSDAGARGLMQLMPATAKAVAEDLGIRYVPNRLTEDPRYNARLGTAYLARMLDRYRGSYVLAAAAYNAGPGRVDEWIRTFGDPRVEEVDPVIWIETIPFTETRNYVMRVLEGLHVYRARLQGSTAPIRLVADINRTG